jgi:hypothetical protein
MKTLPTEKFSNCFPQNKEPEPSEPEGLADVRIVRAIYESARTAKVVELPDFPKSAGQPCSRKYIVPRTASQKP